MQSVEKQESCSWVFDSLVGFLHGPIWNVPLQTFIEEKSLPFEPTESGEVHEKPEYKEIHEEYRNLVDVMLGSFMEDIGISAEQFEEACRMSRQELEGLPIQFHRRLFQQIWAANDYTMFTKMMTHKNVELQLQALELIERRFGALPDLFVQTTSEYQEYGESPRSDDTTKEWPDKDEIMTEIKKLTLTDSTSDNEDVVNAPEPTKLNLDAERKLLKTKLLSFDKSIPEESDTPVKQGAGDSRVDRDAYGVEKEMAKQKVSAEEVKQRQEYLKRQRDKLLTLKRQVREKQLGSAEEAAELVSRPKSARAAHAVLAGKAPTPPPTAAPHDNSLQLRKALVDRLKAEVVDNN